MSLEYKRVVNTAKNSVAIIFNGQQVNLPPGESEVDSALADAFVENSPHVYPAQNDIGVAFEGNSIIDDKIWIANMTGNPDAPDQVTTKSFINKRWEAVSIANPNKEARLLKKVMQGPMIEIIAKDGVPEGLNTLPYNIKIPPYTRVHLPKNIAEWWLRRESLKEREYQGGSIKSRAPSEFEPNLNWPMSDLNLYLKFVDPDAKDLPSEDDIVKKATLDLQNQFRATIGGKTKGKSEQMKKFVADNLKKEMYKAKQDAMKRLFFRLADPKFKLPTREEFEILKTGGEVPDVQVDEAQVNAVLDALDLGDELPTEA